MKKSKLIVSLLIISLCFINTGCFESNAEPPIFHIQHEYDVGVVYTDATCGTDGLLLYTCKICKEKLSEVIKRTNEHDYDLGEVKLAPTCKDKGEKEYSCKVCNNTKSEEIEKVKEHTYSDWSIDANPTCTTQGTLFRTCKVCEKRENKDGENAKGHDFSGNSIVDIAPTCTRFGSSFKVCSRCNVHSNSEQIAKLPHTYGEPVIVPPTRTQSGSSTITCINCVDNVITTLPMNPTLPMNTDELISDMGTGWNLGNSFDAHNYWDNYETTVNERAYDMRDVLEEELLLPENAYIYEIERVWGNPDITKELIKAIKNMGYKTIRLPITWYDHIDKDSNINPVWMARVKQVVNWIIEEDLYCIINIHHDGHYGSSGWLTTNVECMDCIKNITNNVFIPCPHEEQRFDFVLNRFNKIWKAISQAFNTVGEKLLFAGMNEVSGYISDYTIGSSNNSNDSKAIFNYALDNINTLNDEFVKTVRKSGNYNSNRFLIAPTYYTIGYNDVIAQKFILPTDSVNAVLAELHAYSPWEFVGEANDNPIEWGNDAGSYDAADMVNDTFRMIDEYFLSRDIPIILGEWGTCSMSDKMSGDKLVKRQNDRVAHAQYFMNKVKEYKLMSIVWDNGDIKTYSLIDRLSNQGINMGINNAITN